MLFHYVGRVKLQLRLVSPVFLLVRFLRSFAFWSDLVSRRDFEADGSNGFLPSSSISLNFVLFFFFGVSHQTYQGEHRECLLLLMDTNSTKDANGCCVNKPLALTVTMTVASLDGRKVGDHSHRVDDSDSNSLLPLPRGGMSQKSDKKYRKRKVQWNDRIGNKLVEVLEYEPSDVSDSDSEDEDDNSCMCSIM